MRPSNAQFMGDSMSSVNWCVCWAGTLQSMHEIPSHTSGEQQCCPALVSQPLDKLYWTDPYLVL
jgi:hypothetical protein